MFRVVLSTFTRGGLFEIWGCCEMGSKWRKLKVALGWNLCVLVPRTDESATPLDDCDTTTERFSDAALLSPAAHWGSSSRPSTPIPTPSSHKSGIKASKVVDLQPLFFKFCGDLFTLIHLSFVVHMFSVC